MVRKKKSAAKQPATTVEEIRVGALATPEFDSTFQERTDPFRPEKRQKRARVREQSSAYVVVRRSGTPSATVPMDRQVFTFGRDPNSCDVGLEGSGVSRVHAQIERNRRGYYKLRDCGSTNGTYINGQRVLEMNIVDGDTFTIGDHRIEFHLEKS